MIRSAEFKTKQIHIPVLVGMEAINIELRLGDGEPIPISGFPRKLVAENPVSCALPNESPDSLKPHKFIPLFVSAIIANTPSTSNSLPRTSHGIEALVLRGRTSGYGRKAGFAKDTR
jgi:hypothetical protein